MKRPVKKQPAKKRSKPVSKKHEHEQREAEVFEPEEPDTAAEEQQIEEPAGAAAPKAASDVTQQGQYRRQLVVDVEFLGDNTVTIVHSCHSDSLFVSMINVGPGVAWAIPPAVTFDSPDALTLTQTAGEGKFRVYITVVP